jgi:uncharacterized protein YeaO (DUF488 family)
MINVKRVYEPPSTKDGYRILVDRLWPRGLSKKRAALDLWMKEIAPSTELRKWFSHTTSRWTEFETKYREELKDKQSMIDELCALEREHTTITLLYAARDEQHNNALVVRDLLTQCHDSNRIPAVADG